MAGKQSSEVKRRTASTRKTTTTRKSSAGKKRNTSGKSANTKASRMQVSEYTEPVGDEIKLIIILAVSILILLSVFGLGGRVGDKAAYLFFGLFGFVAYALPFLLFIGSAFHISNRGSRLARIKLTAATVFLIMIMALMALADSSFDGTASVLDGFLNSAAAHNGGGLIGFSLSWVLFNAFGRAGSTVILVCLMLVSGVLITGKRIFIRLGTLIGHMMTDMGQHFNAWREKRTRERLARMEAKAAEEDSLPEDEAYENIDEETVSIQPKKKAANIIIPSRKKENVKSKDPAPASSSEPVLQTYTEESATSAETAVISDDSKQPSLDSFDQGQSVQPLHIQIPEFMTGHVSGKSSVKAPSASISDIMSNLSRDIPSEAESEPETETVEDKKPKGKPVIARTILSPDDLELEIEGLPEETPVNTDDTFIDISKILSEIPETTGNIHTEVADMQPEDVSPAAQAEQQTAVSPTVARTSSPSHHTTAKGTVEDTASGSDEPLEIVEEEIEKYEFPPLDLLDQGKVSGNQQTAASLKQTALKLQQTFESFGVGVQVTNVSCGPAVTRYELQPDQGVKVSRIVSLSDDIKLNLAVADIRIEAPIPGKAAVGIEVPNTHKEMVHLRDLLESDKCKQAKSKLAFAVGKDIGGQTVVADIEKMPHLLIAGATGSGKSVCINTIIMSILFRADPNEVKMIMIDPKVVELNVYNGLPHLLIPVVTDPKKAAGSLNWAVNTMMDRYNKFAEIGAKDLKSYNARVENLPYESEQHKKMPQIIIIIDELADLMMVAQSEVEDAICRLAQLARAAGIHLIIATQRPSVNVITGLIKANVPSRIAFSVSSGVDSRTILDMNGAEKLLGNGDMLFYPQGLQKPVRVQGAFVSENEIARVTDFIRAHLTSQPVYSETIKKSIETAAISSPSGASGSDKDVYFEEAGRFIIEKDKASIGMLQRVYKIGFNRAARIMDQLCEAGVVGPEIGTKPRQIKMTMEEFETYLNGNQ